MKLKTLKPRLKEVPARLRTLRGGWRGEKTTAQRGYGGRWQRERLVFLRANPLCVYCAQEGRVTAASVVDHRIPHQGDERLFWDRSNWQPLCAPCHDSVKKREEARGGVGDMARDRFS
jgi:5-methylcytosine-specific restriction endonuclease McrA